MISFRWNNIDFDLTNIGGGVLANEDVPRHAHAKNSIEFHYILDGRGVLETDTAKYTLEKNSFFITGEGFYHSQKSDRDFPMRDVFFTLQAKQIKKGNAYSDTLMSTPFYIDANTDTSLAELALEEYRNRLPDFASAVTGIIIKLLSDTVRKLLPETFTDIDIADGLNERMFIIIEMAFLYDKNITLSKLSEQIGVCERQTQRLLKKYYSKSFREIKREFSNSDKNKQINQNDL